MGATSINTACKRALVGFGRSNTALSMNTGNLNLADMIPYVTTVTREHNMKEIAYIPD